MPPVRCGNPDWALWVDELATRAEERGEKSAKTYKRAAASLHSCPISFAHPDDAIQLRGVGPKIIDYLVSKMREKCEQEGLPMPDRIPSPSRPRKVHASKKRMGAEAPMPDDGLRKARIPHASQSDVNAAPSVLRSHPDRCSGSPASQDDAPLADPDGKGKGKAKAPPKARQYIPRQNSGAYAIVLALYKNSSADEPSSWMTKTRIMETGQEYSSTPFGQASAARNSQAQGGQTFAYSAWNGMKTLLEKEIVITDNRRPAKFALTEAGYSLAERLAASAGISLHVRLPTSSSSAHSSSPGVEAIGASVYGLPSRRASSPLVAFSDEDFEAGAGSTKDQFLDEIDIMQESLYHTRDAKNMKLPSDPAGLGTSTGKFARGLYDLDETEAPHWVHAVQEAEHKETTRRKNVDNISGSHYLNEPDQRILVREEAEVPVHRHPLDSVGDHVPPSDYRFTPFPPIVWPAGSFKVYLVVDTREGTREQGKRIELCEKFEREGVPVVGKMLPLGDMLWIARRVDPTTGRPTGMDDDVVLDAIVERKRLDDLCSSILDGRYIGQKFRLKDSGISHRIYLIEKYDAAAQYERFGKQIWTCKSQLQVNDGFYVHESANIADTISYLKRRTQVMSELYESTDLHIIPDALIDRSTYLALQHSLRLTPGARPYHPTYTAFCALNRPDAARTLRAQWGSMLQRVSGLGAEKAVQMVQRWETPGAFFEEACAHERVVEQEHAPLGALTGAPDTDDAAAAASSPKKAKKKKQQKNMRKAEDFIVEELDRAGAGTTTRGIRGKLGARVWELFMTRGKYLS